MIETLRAMSTPGSFGFAAPIWIAILAPLVVWLLWRGARRAPPSIPWPAFAEARAAGGRARDPSRALALLLRGACGLSLVAALAGPTLYSRAQPETESQRGLDLLLVVDASGSMRALDAEVDGHWRTRLDLAREVVGRFALHRMGEGDRVGVVVFGDSAFTLCPLTHDGVLLEAALQRIEAGVAGEATALGDALALAVKRVGGAAAMAELGASQAPADPERPGRPAAGRVVVLLTDGRANAGAVPLDVAAALAAVTRTRVHTVGIGSAGEVPMASRSGRGQELRFERHDLDERALEDISSASGGRVFLARSSADLAQVYDEIDALERIPRPAPPRSGGRPTPEPLLAAAGLLLLAELAGTRVFGRRLP